MSAAHQITNTPDAQKFLLAGSATVTLVSKRTGKRYTYKIKKVKNWMPDKPRWFVGALTGPDNEDDYTYLGSIHLRAAQYVFTPSAQHCGAPSTKAFEWAWPVLCGDSVHEQLEVWHEGRCGRCNRKLTVPESIKNGIGPECAGKV